MTVLRRPQKNEVKKLLVVVCYMTPLNIVFNEENSNGCPAREPRKKPGYGRRLQLQEKRWHLFLTNVSFFNF